MIGAMAKVSRSVMIAVVICTSLVSGWADEIILDDEDVGWYGTGGGWLDNAAGVNGNRQFNGDIRYVLSASVGGHQGVWRFKGEAGQEYTVAAHWYWDSSYQTAAVYTISGDISGGNVTSVVNQCVEPTGDFVRTERVGLDSQNFETIGVATVTGNGWITVTVQGTAEDGLLSADAILVTGTVASASIYAITNPVVDDGDVGFEAVGSWLSTTFDMTYGNDHLYSSTQNNTAYWTNTVDEGATYKVCASWRGLSLYLVTAPYDISGVDGGPYTVNVDQSTYPTNYCIPAPDTAAAGKAATTFYELGEYVASDTEIVVKLTHDGSDTYACADAIACLKIAEAPPPRGTILIIK